MKKYYQERECSILLIFFYVAQVQTNTFTVSVPSGPINFKLGQDAVIPCFLSPSISAVNMKVTWLQNHLLPILVYENQIETSGPNFAGRTSLNVEQLIHGELSLLIKNVQVMDEGHYSCSASQGASEQSASIEVKISATGTYPLISLDEQGNKVIHLTCVSEGWYPPPELFWIDGRDRDLTLSTTKEKSREGLFLVKSTILVSQQDSPHLSCMVKSRGKTELKSRIEISGDFYRAKPWVVALSVATPCLLVFILLVAIFTYKTEGKYKKYKKVLEERESSLDKTRKECDDLKIQYDNCKQQAREEIQKAREYACDLTLDPATAHPKLKVSEDNKSVKYAKEQTDVPNNEQRYKYWSGVLGSEGFTSGQHYWEVNVKDLNHWDLGIAKESVSRDQIGDIQPKMGYWSIWFVYKEYRALDEARSVIRTNGHVDVVGVHLNFDEGKVVFYDVNNYFHLYTFHAEFKEKVFPFFNPWGNETEMKLMTSSNEVENVCIA
ncbi:butyrophilin subfamily 1 member A1-like [Erpetoichthys calabaricus]|uniref:butyrophilin subfamily 1 member A1-like n=1 Tax=Erpetoichthys calabaricus TaxID=27687 RepID=UPI0022349C2E|nr:butyrophilin subfamily 1 member A1-like [Erpetoichthys calabaricus]